MSKYPQHKELTRLPEQLMTKLGCICAISGTAYVCLLCIVSLSMFLVKIRLSEASLKCFFFFCMSLAQKESFK